MYKLLTKNGQLFALGLGIIAIAVAILSMTMGISGAGYSLSDDLNSIMKNNPDQSFDFFNPAVLVVLILIVIALIAWVLFSLYSLISDPKGSIKFLIGIGILAVVFFALYSMSAVETDAGMRELMDRFAITDGVSKVISGGLKTTVLLAVLSAVAIVIMEVLNFFK